LLLRNTRSWSWAEGAKTSTTTYTIWLMPTSKIQCSFDYSKTSNETETSSYSGFLSWNISDYFLLRLNYSRTKTEETTSWAFGLNFTMRF